MTRTCIAAAVTTALIVTPTLPASAQTARTISRSDKAQGAQAHPQLLSEFGGAYTGPQAAFVERVGKRVAVQSGLSNAQGDFTVTLLDSPVENAFAIPGGYVYVTRQLLALMNSEAELAAVLGHEVGHVAARHSNKRNTRATLGGLLSAGVGWLTGSDVLGRIASTGTQLYTLGFSRSQEYEADGLGVRYATAAGYDPYGMSAMLRQLNDDQTLAARIEGRQADAVPTWASTHPNGEDRVARARQLAQQMRAAPASNVQDTAFLRMLDGLPYDDNPAQGIIDGQTFRHPQLRLQFTAPAGYKIDNGTDAVTVAGTGGQAQFRAAAATSDLPGFVRARLGELGARDTSGVELRTSEVNGLQMVQGTVSATSNGRAVDATVVAYRFPSATYYFLVVTPSGNRLGAFASMVSSVAQLSPQAAAAIKGKRIRIVTVKAGDTIDSLARQMAYPSYQRERFVTLNGLEDTPTLTPGRLVKLVVAG
ncbi:M48 family metalloprotease [Sphingomonas sp. MJ1 (PH-R8)]|uniref:M48 family metalloprotease n=1 Tax=Sphingomonas sp. MJ1 (PH-R8) TaxID=3112950 RepID=UPI003A859D70